MISNLQIAKSKKLNYNKSKNILPNHMSRIPFNIIILFSNFLYMELLENITGEKLNLLVKQIIGKSWHVSSLTEIYSQTDPFSCYQKWDLHFDEIIDGDLTDHQHQRFTLYYFLHGTLEMQLIIILNGIKEEMELKKSSQNFNLYKFV